MTQIRSQMGQLNSSANDVFIAYMGQGQPFSSDVDHMCGHGLMSFPPFHANGIKREKLVELYRIMVYFDFSLDDTLKFQKTLYPNDQNLHSKLKSTMDILPGLLSNVLCRLCSKNNMRLTDTIYGLNISQENVFHKKKLGCELLLKYTQLIPYLAWDF
ncbi:leukemia inhibitory factor-like [Elephas maximus indicus]|uniref:leukemia inhibitory factor-like n=1 Tax=Elephas maximus indicus TaxID=99487 RepID=UPI002116551E|nr:leukemia inhibitory factor-like [Elephas maximus indicus]